MGPSLKAALAPIEPNARSLHRYEAIMRWGGWAGRLAIRRWVQAVDVKGLEHVAKGPLLLLCNHSCVFDPYLLTVHARRPIQFLITEPFMSIGVPSQLVAWWGQVPKRKLDPDARALRLLKAWCQVGGVAGVFPEGQFPWDGRPLPLQPGLKQLVQYLDVPVVTMRLINGDRLWPPWARHPRRTKLRLEIDAPRKLAPDEVEATIAKSIHVDPDTCPRWPSEGSRLAEGLARFLRYCPACGSESLEDPGDVLRCVKCLQRWTVTADNRIGEMTVEQARQKAQAHWRSAWQQAHRFKSLGPVDVIDVSSREAELVQTGEAELEDHRLRVGSWELEGKDVIAHTMDWGERILVRTPRQRVALRMPYDSRALWTVALDELRRAG